MCVFVYACVRFLGKERPLQALLAALSWSRGSGGDGNSTLLPLDQPTALPSRLECLEPAVVPMLLLLLL